MTAKVPLVVYIHVLLMKRGLELKRAHDLLASVRLRLRTNRPAGAPVKQGHSSIRVNQTLADSQHSLSNAVDAVQILDQHSSPNDKSSHSHFGGSFALPLTLSLAPHPDVNGPSVRLSSPGAVPPQFSTPSESHTRSSAKSSAFTSTSPSNPISTLPSPARATESDAGQFSQLLGRYSARYRLSEKTFGFGNQENAPFLSNSPRTQHNEGKRIDIVISSPRSSPPIAPNGTDDIHTPRSPLVTPQR